MWLIILFSGQCIIEKDPVSQQSIARTFDDITYTLPEMSDDCEILLAKDASSSHLFTVLMSNSEGHKQLNIVLPQTQIQLQVSGGSWSGTLEVHVQINGQEERLSEGESKPITIDRPGRPVIAQITKQDNGAITIDSQKLGLTVSVCEKKVSIKVIYMWKNMWEESQH